MSLGDDEYDYWKAEAGNVMRDHMGLADNPLDGDMMWWLRCVPLHNVSVFLLDQHTSSLCTSHYLVM